MNNFIKTEEWQTVIGIAVMAFFIGGIILAICGFWLKRNGHVIRGKKLFAIGVFTTFFAMVAALFEKTF